MIRCGNRLELDALQLEEEEEGPSYLADLNKAPDFIDEPPVEVTDVSLPFIHFQLQLSEPGLPDTGQGSCEDKRIVANILYLIGWTSYYSVVQWDTHQ